MPKVTLCSLHCARQAIVAEWLSLKPNVLGLRQAGACGGRHHVVPWSGAWHRKPDVISDSLLRQDWGWSFTHHSGPDILAKPLTSPSFLRATAWGWVWKK
jgi:hypothetical protein